jgi:hypothetical protein
MTEMEQRMIQCIILGRIIYLSRVFLSHHLGIAFAAGIAWLQASFLMMFERRPLRAARLCWWLLLLLTTIAAAVTTTTMAVNWEHPNANVWPAIRGVDPDHLPHALGLWSAETWEVTLDCRPARNDCPDEVQEMIDEAMDRFAEFLEAFVPRSSPSEHHPINPTNATLYPIRGLKIIITTAHVTLLDADESYSIDTPVTGRGSTTGSGHDDDDYWIVLSANTVYGALHGLTTLQQLLTFGWIAPPDDTTNQKNEPMFIMPVLSGPLVDQPAYRYRGLMVDTARHYLPLSLLEYTLEIMAAHKLNVLHWHMTDSQSWPYQSTHYPELSATAAYCELCIYTPDEIRHLQNIARRLGIRIVAEFDLPGHSQGEFFSDV